MDNNVNASKSSWYRQPLVWLVLAIPASAVVMGAVMITISVYSFDGMVDDDYYRRGLEINRDLNRDEAAARLGLRAELSLDFDRRTVAADLSWEGTIVNELPARLRLRLIHPTRAGMDRILILERDPGGVYRGELEPMAAGNWHLQLETNAWRLPGRLPLPGSGRVGLAPLE